MDFSDWFRSSKDNLSAFAPAPNTQKTLDNLFPLSAATQPHFIDSDDVETSVDRLLSIPLDKRMHLMLDSDVYKKAHQEMLDKEVNRIKKAQLERAKKQHPEWGNDVGLKNVRFSEEAFEALQDQLAKTFLSAILRPSEIDQAYANLLNPQKKLSLADKKVLTIFLYVWKHNLSVLTRKFGVRNGAFQSIIAKGATELSDIIGQALKDDPKALLLYGAKCCLDHKGFDVSDLTFGADRWVARWLPQKLTRALICGKPMIPTIGTETAEPTQKDITRLQRYQHSFNRALLYYLIKSPTQAQDVFKLVFPNITKMKPDMQEQLWSVLFHKYRVDPEIRSDVVSFMTTFLAQEKDLKAKKAMYGVFVHILPPDKRADILGHFPTKALSKYRATFAPIYPQTTFASVRTDTETTSLVWRLFHEKEIDIPHMKQILKGVNPQTHRHFLFAPKTRMDSELFSYMCGVFSNSPFYFWQWVRSFQAMSDFPKALAGIYPELPESVRNNKHYLAAMNNHYGLIRECALAGDTGTLSALKKILGKDIFWASLTQSSDGKVSGIRSLCKQGKRGLLKLMADFPLSRQQELFMEANSDGRTLLDDCGGSLARLVSQVVFQQVYQKEADPISPVSTPVVPSEKPQSTPVANRPMRQIIRIPVFDSHMARIANNSKLVKEVEEAMQTLAKMSKAEIFAEMRGGLRHHGSLDKAPCVVKGIRGNNYRLGYLLQGDIDQGTGQIAFLFFLTHAQYNIFLNKQADQAIRVAKAIMATPTGPTGPLGGRDGR